MFGRLLNWAVNNVFLVVLMAVTLAVVGGYAFTRVNIEAYPDPAPAIIEVVAQYPGASAEEVERQVTIPLEISLAGMPGLKYTRSKSMFGLAHLRNQFEYGIEYAQAKQEVLNRLAGVKLPSGVDPQISPASPIGEIYRYILKSPRDGLGRPIYALNDLKALQDWTLEREFLRIPGVAGVVSSGGTVKIYEIRPDPERMREFGITLDQLEKAVSESNANVGGNFVVQGANVQVVRGIGLIGGGNDPMVRAMNLSTSEAAAAYLRKQEQRRIREIRQIVVAATDNIPVRVGQLVEGGSVRSDDELGRDGVVVGYQTRQGQVGITRPVGEAAESEGHAVVSAEPRKLVDEDDVVQGIILLRKGEKSIPALEAVQAKIAELNDKAGKLLPGVQIEPYYNRASLIEVTTHTVHHNLVVGMFLVTVILLMFLSNVRSALIVAINVPLALLFAFGVLYFRGKSANLLSIGAVDFGIIVDSTVIMVENIFRRISSGDSAELPFQERILRAGREVEKSLFYSTLIMVCALLPLFTMQGPEGQIFGPMADTYAFALGGALLLALTVSPVLACIFFRKLKPTKDNFMVRWLKNSVLWQLNFLLDHRWVGLGFMALLVGITAGVLPYLGREFMPELEEGNMVVRATFPVNMSMEEAARNAHTMRGIISKYPETKLVASQVGRPDDGTDPTGFNEVQCFVPLQNPQEWPKIATRGRSRSKPELVAEMSDELSRAIPGVNWDFSQIIRDNVMESLSGVKGENSVKIFGPDLDELERLAAKFSSTLGQIQGVREPGVFRINGQTSLAFPIDRAKCATWNVNVDDVEHVIETAVGGRTLTEMIEGEKRFGIALRWPARLRSNADQILEIPVEVVKNTMSGNLAGLNETPQSGASTGLSRTGSSLSMPALTGSSENATLNDLARVPRRRLRDLVTPVDADGYPDPEGSFVQPGAAVISREQGRRLIAVKFSVRDRDLAGTVAEAQATTGPLLKAPYESTWSGEFQQMQEAEHRMLVVVVIALILIFVLLYLAFYSLLDALLVYSNVVAMSLGGLWALLGAGLNFNISAAVGFISILGVAVMNGLLMVSSYNSLRAHQVPLREAILQGTEKLVRPVTMTALAAILGLLPAAFSTQIGSQSQRPLAIVVVGGMMTTLMLFNLVPLLYSFYGHREPNKHAGEMAH